MLGTLIRQEILTHLMSARFLAAVIITQLLVVTNTVVLINVHEQRVADYNHQERVHNEKIRESETYSTLSLFIERPPNPLSLFSEGLDKQLGGTLEIYHSYVPMVSDYSAESLDNPYLQLFTSIDLVYIFQVMLSLLALLFAYDAVAGDLEKGTLRLVISHPVGRGSILLSKYIGALGSLMLPVLISLLMVLVLLSASGSLNLSGDDFLRIGGIVLTTVIYLSAFYLMGLLISTINRRSATSLMFCMFLWVFLVLIYPNWSRFAIDPVTHIRSEKLSTNEQLNQIWEEADRAEHRFLENSPLKGRPPAFNLNLSESHISRTGSRYQANLKLGEGSEQLVPHVQNFNEVIGALQIRLAEKSGVIRQHRLAEGDIKQAIWDERLMKLSPASLYRFTTSAWAGTDLAGTLDFIGAAQEYRRSIIDYFYDRNAFGSREWFASDQKTTSWWDLPNFRFQRAPALENATRALPGTCALLLMNVLLFMVSFFWFLKTEM